MISFNYQQCDLVLPGKRLNEDYLDQVGLQTSFCEHDLTVNCPLWVIPFIRLSLASLNCAKERKALGKKSRNVHAIILSARGCKCNVLNSCLDFPIIITWSQTVCHINPFLSYVVFVRKFCHRNRNQINRTINVTKFSLQSEQSEHINKWWTYIRNNQGEFRKLNSMYPWWARL